MKRMQQNPRAALVCLSTAFALIFPSAPALADADLRQQLAKPLVATLNTSKQPNDIQLCVADAIGEGLLPLPFPPDGAGTVHIFGFGGLMGAGTVQRAVSLIKTQQGTRIEIRTRSGRPDVHLAKMIGACL